MTTLLEIAQQQAEFVRNSGITVEISRGPSWVTLDSAKDELFLQDHEGEKFIDEVGDLWNKLQHIGLREAELAVAYQYLDVMSPKEQ